MIGEVTDGDTLRIMRDGDRRRRHAGRRACRRLPALRPRARRLRRRRSTPAPAADARGRLVAARHAAGAAGVAEHRVAPAAVRAVRLPRRCAHRRADPSRPTRPCWRCPTGAGIAISIDGSGRRVAADPYRGTVEAVLECAANLACVGAEPLGLTNCLNFGNPEKPHIAWQLTEAIRGARRRLPRARRRRSSAATSRSTTRAPTARSTRRRSSAWSASCPTRSRPASSASRARATSSRSSAGARRRRWPARELAKLRGEPLPDELPATDIAERRGGARGDPRRRPRQRSVVVSRHRRGRLLVALAEAALAGGIGAI